jgi:hypothetical protein
MTETNEQANNAIESSTLLASGCGGCKWEKVEIWPLTHDSTQDCTHKQKPSNLFQIQDYNVECPLKEANDRRDLRRKGTNG